MSSVDAALTALQSWGQAQRGGTHSNEDINDIEELVRTTVVPLLNKELGQVTKICDLDGKDFEELKADSEKLLTNKTQLLLSALRSLNKELTDVNFYAEARSGKACFGSLIGNIRGGFVGADVGRADLFGIAEEMSTDSCTSMLTDRVGLKL